MYPSVHLAPGRLVASLALARCGHQRLPLHIISKQQENTLLPRSCATAVLQSAGAASIEAPSINREEQAAAASPSRPPSEQHESEAAARQAEQPSTSVSSNSSAAIRPSIQNSNAGTLKQEALQDRQEVADKLIAVFLGKSPAEWRKLIAFSRRWPALADSVFEQLEQRMAIEMEATEKSALRKLARRLHAVHAELQEYSELLSSFRARGAHEWEAMVATSRPSFTAEFFAHAENLVRASAADPAEQEELARVAAKLLALVHAHDEVAENAEAMQGAALRFDSLLQVSSLEEADGKIDEMAKTGKLDPALLLTMAKAYAAAKETDKTQEEVKDIMAHLYFKAKESFARMQPPEVRILKHLLALEDPQRLREELASAFEHGPELATEQQDFLSTTPERLAGAVEAILGAYDRSAGSGGMLGQAGALMSPAVIARMRDLLALIRKDYL